MAHKLYQHGSQLNIPAKIWGADTHEDYIYMMENKEQYDGFMNMIIVLDSFQIYICNSKGEWNPIGGETK